MLRDIWGLSHPCVIPLTCVLLSLARVSPQAVLWFGRGWVPACSLCLITCGSLASLFALLTFTSVRKQD